MADGGDGGLDAAAAADGANASADMPCDANDARSGADANADAYADAYVSGPHDAVRPHSPWHCWPAYRQTVRSYWPTPPADVSAGDSDAGAHGTGTADASAAAPTPGCASVPTVGPEIRLRSAAFPRTVAADCRPTPPLLLPIPRPIPDSGNTAKWRDWRHAATGGPSAGAAGRGPGDSRSPNHSGRDSHSPRTCRRHSPPYLSTGSWTPDSSRSRPVGVGQPLQRHSGPPSAGWAALAAPAAPAAGSTCWAARRSSWTFALGCR